MMRMLVMKTLLLISFFTEFSGQLFFFTLPLLAIKYGASAQQLGILGSITSFFYIPFSVIFGSLSEKRLKINIPFISALVIFIFISVAVFFKSIQLFYFITALAGIAFAGFWIPMMIRINEEAKQQKSQIVGKFSVAWSTGTILGPLVAGFLYQKYYLLPLILSSMLFLCICIILFFLTRPSVSNRKISEKIVTTRTGSTDVKTLIAVFAGTFGVYFSFGAIRNLFPRLATDIGIQPYKIGMMFCLMDVFKTITFFTFSKKTSLYLKYYYFILLGIISYFSLTAVICTNSILLFSLNFVLLGGIMSGIYYAYGLYTAFTMEKGRAIAVGMFEAIIGIGVGCGSIAGGFLISILGERAPYIVSMLVGIILSVFQIIETTDKKHL